MRKLKALNLVIAAGSEANCQFSLTSKFEAEDLLSFACRRARVLIDFDGKCNLRHRNTQVHAGCTSRDVVKIRGSTGIKILVDLV